jgi:predicted aminopeptidase
VQEPAFRQHVEFYAKNDEAFNKDFAAVFARVSGR